MYLLIEDIQTRLNFSFFFIISYLESAVLKKKEQIRIQKESTLILGKPPILFAKKRPNGAETRQND